MTSAWLLSPGGGDPSRQLAVDAASLEGVPVLRRGLRRDLPGRIEPSRSQRRCQSQRSCSVARHREHCRVAKTGRKKFRLKVELHKMRADFQSFL